MKDPINTRWIGAAALGAVVLSLACAAAFVLMPPGAPDRAGFGASGVVTGGLGAGVGVYCAVRLRERLSVVAACLAPVVVAAWAWLTWRHAVSP